MPRYFIVYKPYEVLSQFTSEVGKTTLGDVFDLPKDIYPVGRLDFDSEGLLILTNDSHLNHRLLNPMNKHEREYWVQVEGLMTTEALKIMRSGITISINGREHKTLPCNAELLTVEPGLPERNPPIRFRKNIPVSWLRLSLVEGKNRQVRRMTAKVGFPTLRLVRYRIENITVQGMQPGNIKEVAREEMYRKLFL